MIGVGGQPLTIYLATRPVDFRKGHDGLSSLVHLMPAAKDGVKRRTWSLEERQRIVAEALAPGASVAAVARRHGLNANLIFKWLRRSREGWLDRRRAPAKGTAAAQTFGAPELRTRGLKQLAVDQA